MTDSDRDRAVEFVALYNHLDGRLRERFEVDKGIGFGRMVEEVARVDRDVAYFAHDLREFADLRNAIVHQAGNRRLLAEPYPEAVAALREIVRRVTDPLPVLAVAARNVRTFAPADPLRDALAHMDEHDFSQVVVQVVRDRDGRLALLTADGVARWLAARLRAGDVDLARATVAEVVEMEQPGAFGVIGRNETALAARARFLDVPRRGHSRLVALVVTEHGRLDQKPLGIVTAADLLDDE